MKKKDLETIREIIDDSDLCDYAWRYIDSGGELTTDAGARKAKKLVDQVMKRIDEAVK